MFAPLENVKIKSIYGGDLPARMALCTPDMLTAMRLLSDDLKAAGGQLILSDLYRSYDMQLQAHLDYETGKKTAYSPPPGGSMHEAGRAFDLDLDALKISLSDFWKLAAKRNLLPIIDTPTSGQNEAWHFDCRGSHSLVYEYYAAKKGDNFKHPYTAMAASAIVSSGVKVDALGDEPTTGFIQSGLIRLGQVIGDLDGRIGPKSWAALKALNIDPNENAANIATAIDKLLQSKFPNEYFVAQTQVLAFASIPAAFSLLDTVSAKYRPDPANRAVLGKVIDLLKDAVPVDQSFELQPDFLATLPNKCLYFDSELQLDTDGWPDGKGKGDKHWGPNTSLRYADNTSLNANRVPYFVLPLPTSWANDRGISLGDFAAIIYKGKVTYAVFGDQGPENKIGEGSIQLLRALGEERIKPNGRVLDAGTDPGVITIVFPGSGSPNNLSDEATLIAATQSEGARLFKALTTT